MLSQTLQIHISIPASSSSSSKIANRGVRASPVSMKMQSNVDPFSGQPAGDDLRRSANYHPTVWEPKLIQSLNTTYTHKLYGNRLDKLREEVSTLLKCTKDISILLKLIDSIQRLGVAYHFNEEIDAAFELVSSSETYHNCLSTTALRFRLLRQRGHFVGTNVFDKFKDENGGFSNRLSNDPEGLLNLYDSSFLGMCGEEVEMEEAMNFSIKHLKLFMLTNHNDEGMKNRVKDALLVPLHWRSPRLEARNYIDLFKVDNGMNSSLLLELATLDFNVVQSLHQEEVKELTIWWNELGLRDKLSFSRDRIMENYLWAMGTGWEPKYSKTRKAITKFLCILAVIDDTFDIYGSLNELEIFMKAVERWDLNAMDELPHYLKICYLAMFNVGNEIAYNVLRDHDMDVTEFVKQEWKRLCTSYLTEARWFYDGYKPSPEEYMDNALISIGGHASIVNSCLLLGLSPLSETSVVSFSNRSGPVYWACLITRLSNDIATSKAEIARGDVPKFIHCYMMHEKVSEKEAKDYLSFIINYSWRKLNEAIIMKRYSHAHFATISLNLTRSASSMYQHGDGLGVSTKSTKEILTSLMVQPIPI